MSECVAVLSGRELDGGRRATGTSSKSFINYLSKVLGNHEIKELRQRAILALNTYLRML